MAETRLALPSPLYARLAALAVPSSAALAALPSPLAAAAPRALLAPLAPARAALASPLGLVRARAWEPRAAPQGVAVAPRPRLLSDPLPLRRGAELPGYRTDAVLPWVYGRVRLAPLPLDETGLEWLLADHPIAAVRAVRDEGTPVEGWELVQRLDPTGHPVAVLRLARPPKGALAVDLNGRLDAATGALLEHPAAICADLVAACGLPPGDWSALRAHWPGVRLGGVLERAEPLREALARVVASVGARWSAAPLRAWVPDAAAPLATLGPAEITRLARDEGERRLTCVRPAGPVRRVTVLRHGALIEARGAQPVSVSYRDGVATFTILDEDGVPLAGAAVTLDEGETRYTDRLGQVQFATQRGVHALLITLSGYAPLEIEVEV